MCPPQDLAGFTQCHFFAGVGVWSLALRRAGWPDSRPVWTGSCPCQPFSAAGKGNGFADERHLWPAWLHLIGQREPVVVFGEQVSSKDADVWVDLVQTDMEALGYAFGAVPFPSAGIGAPHIRDRLYWLADSANQRFDGRGSSDPSDGGNPTRVEFERFCDADRMDNADDAGLEGFGGGHKTEGWGPGQVRPASPASESCRLEYATGDDQLQQRPHGEPEVGFKHDEGRRVEGTATITGLCGDSVPGPVNGRWSDADWLFCRDGKWRPVESCTFPLANGAPARVGRLRAYGNAINAEAAEAVIRAYMECRP